MAEKAFDQVRRHGGDRYGRKRTAATVKAAAATTALRARLQPLTHVGIEADPVHVVVKSLAQAAAQEVMVRAYGVVELDVVMCKRNVSWRAQCDAIFLRMQTYWRVRRRREAMPIG